MPVAYSPGEWSDVSEREAAGGGERRRQPYQIGTFGLIPEAPVGEVYIGVGPEPRGQPQPGFQVEPLSAGSFRWPGSPLVPHVRHPGPASGRRDRDSCGEEEGFGLHGNLNGPAKVLLGAWTVQRARASAGVTVSAPGAPRGGVGGAGSTFNDQERSLRDWKDLLARRPKNSARAGLRSLSRQPLRL